MAYMIMPIYNTDRPVGESLPNKNDDVRLVQTLLAELKRATGGTWGAQRPIIVDGRFGPITRDWILSFQKLMNQKSRVLVEDGKVHPMKMQGSYDWAAKFGPSTYSTLFALNDMLRRKARNVHQQLGLRLSLRESTPGS